MTLKIRFPVWKGATIYLECHKAENWRSPALLTATERIIERKDGFQAKRTIMINLFFDYDHPTLRVVFVSTVIILGLLIINDLIPGGAFGRRTRRSESNLVLIVLAILVLAIEWAVYMFLWLKCELLILDLQHWISSTSSALDLKNMLAVEFNWWLNNSSSNSILSAYDSHVEVRHSSVRVAQLICKPHFILKEGPLSTDIFRIILLRCFISHGSTFAGYSYHCGN